MPKNEEYVSQNTVLIADDKPIVLEILDTILQMDGLRVFVAHNGKEAVECAQTNPR
jgi:CheY-like chemotaxis protein